MATKTGSSYMERELLTPTQFAVLERLRRGGTKNFSRSDYVVLKTIKQNCRNTVKHFEAAKHIFVEIDEAMR